MNNGLLAEALAAGIRAAEKPLKPSEALYQELLAEWLAELEQSQATKRLYKQAIKR